MGSAEPRRRTSPEQPQSGRHHYVPRWYQKRFLTPGKTKFSYLDLHPETVVRDGVAHQRKALLNWGPASCFYKEDLYTMKLGSWTTDEIERRFFGEVDRRGRAAVEHFAEFEEIAEPTWDAGRDLVPYMDAQKFRTPRGLDRLKKRAGDSDQNRTLVEMQRNFESSTMWMEGVWEIVRARRSPTKFIVTDDPVTFYNRSVFPSEWVYPDDIGLKGIGSRTLFPLGLDSCLIITHLQLARNPWSIPTEPRTNARSFQSAMKHLGEIQFGRELEEDEVLRINYILKKSASRYIAAAEEEWLYPERRVPTRSGQGWTRTGSCFPTFGGLPSPPESTLVTRTAHHQRGTSTGGALGIEPTTTRGSETENGKRWNGPSGSGPRSGWGSLPHAQTSGSAGAGT